MKVAVAVITNEQGRILVTQRPLHVAQGGLWEFPGGKLEPDESAEDALVREVREELGLEVLKCCYLGEVTHQYPDKTVQLLVFHVQQFTGEAACLEGQLNMEWIEQHRLSQSDFPEANRAVFDLLSLLEPIKS